MFCLPPGVGLGGRMSRPWVRGVGRMSGLGTEGYSRESTDIGAPKNFGEWDHQTPAQYNGLTAALLKPFWPRGFFENRFVTLKFSHGGRDRLVAVLGSKC